ncbi:hypothetical protein [Caballeronia sp. GAOx1]|uniref:hypothetical protein n=1 Tax=Caballeronia sp. GAOx1 TaxID=2921761 RepID=UPI0020279300|nr:hypothetical protein [Caballeronia sp. GAOx1]
MSILRAESAGNTEVSTFAGTCCVSSYEISRAGQSASDERSAQLLCSARSSVIQSLRWPADEEAVIVSGREVVPNLVSTDSAEPISGMAIEGSKVYGLKRDRRRSEPQSQLPVEHKPETLAFETDRDSVVADRFSIANMICAAGEPVLSKKVSRRDRRVGRVVDAGRLSAKAAVRRSCAERQQDASFSPFESRCRDIPVLISNEL